MVSARGRCIRRDVCDTACAADDDPRHTLADTPGNLRHVHERRAKNGPLVLGVCREPRRILPPFDERRGLILAVSAFRGEEPAPVNVWAVLQNAERELRVLRATDRKESSGEERVRATD